MTFLKYLHGFFLKLDTNKMETRFDRFSGPEIKFWRKKVKTEEKKVSWMSQRFSPSDFEMHFCKPVEC